MPTFDAAGRDRITPDPVLTQISIAFEANTDYIAPILFPTVRTGQVGTYSLFGRRAFAVNFGGTVRAPGARANEIEALRKYAEDQFFCIEHALEGLVPDEERENNPDENPDAEKVEELTDRLLLGKELAVRDMVYDQTAYKTSHVVTLGSGEHFDEYSTSDPIEVFRDLFREFHESTGILPNISSIPWKIMSYLEDHPVIVGRYAQTGALVTPEQIAALLGLERILVPGGAYNTATNPARQQVLADIWADHILLAYVPPRPARRTPALGYEFLWPIQRGRRTRDNISVDRRRDDDRIGDIHRTRRRYDLKLVGRDPDVENSPIVAGALIRNVLSS